MGLTRYQWLVLSAAWLGWGFDVFDALLFNFVAPNCVPLLLGLAPGSPAAREATIFWTGLLSALLLVGWAAGGVLFGWVADRYGRKRALILTIVIYALGTTLCAAAMNIWQLVAFRAITSLGIGGEWAVGAALVAEVVPEERRIEAGTLLQTASPLGIMLAAAVNYQVAGVWFADDPANSWRFVFLCGLAPVVLALIVRAFVHESEHWRRNASRSSPPAPRELFTRSVRPATWSALLVSVTGLLTWWAVNAFIPVLGGLLAQEHAAASGIGLEELRTLTEAWKARASNAFNLGGLLGAFIAIPLARHLGRRPMYVCYFLYSAVALFLSFGLPLSPPARVFALFFVGVGVYGIFSTYVFYLPELFPTRLRALGSGFCFNIGRVAAALGPFIVGSIAAQAGGDSRMITTTLFWVGMFPLLAALASLRFVMETRGRALQ